MNSLLDHEDVAAISFVDFTTNCRICVKRGTSNLKWVQALTGEKTILYVLKHANLDNATTQIMNATFDSVGEHCMACVVVAIEDYADEFIEQSVEKANNIKIGTDLDEGVF